MSYSVPDICDEFSEEISVLKPLFADFGSKEKLSGEIVTIKCFEDNTLVGDAVKSPGEGRVLRIRMLKGRYKPLNSTHDT
ncbi:hypothetical protein ACFL00_04015 [Pseudomonadota bacterium]